MPAANVPLVIDQGEDFTCQIVWTDDHNQPHNMIDPMRIDIKSGPMVVLSLTTPEAEIPDGQIPEISYSSEVGLIQIHIPNEQTELLQAGTYQYDMFVTVNDGDEYAGNQQFRLIAGQVIVNQRITVM